MDYINLQPSAVGLVVAGFAFAWLAGFLGRSVRLWLSVATANLDSEKDT